MSLNGVKLVIERKLNLKELLYFLSDTDYGKNLPLNIKDEFDYRYNIENITREEILDMAVYIYQKCDKRVVDTTDYLNIVTHIIAHTEEIVTFRVM